MHTSAPDAVSPLLSATGLSAGYGKLRVLDGLDVEIRDREIVAMVGPNGAGKSTLLRALSGLIPKTAGNVRFAGQDISRFSTRECGRAGLVHVIEGHRVLPSLTVEENLLLAALDQGAAERQAPWMRLMRCSRRWPKSVRSRLARFPADSSKRSSSGRGSSGGLGS